MDLYLIILIFHIVVGVLSLGLSLFGIKVILQQRAEYFSKLSKYIGISLIFGITSGVGLIILQFNQGSLIHSCLKLGLYLIIVGGTEIVLIKRQQLLAS